ncbi:MAG: Hpt domain-containing protein [Flavobacterium sp.]
MALHYNLSKVYALSDNDPEFVNEILQLFITEVPADLELIQNGIKDKNYHQAYSYSHKIKPTLDLLGLNIAFAEVLQIEAWTRREGKRKEIKDSYKAVETQVEKAIKEIKKDFNI